MDKDRLEILLYNAIDLLLVAYIREDLLDELGMTFGEYSQVMHTHRKAIVEKDRLEILLCNALDLLLAENNRSDILEELGMTLDEYNQVMGTDTETGE